MDKDAYIERLEEENAELRKRIQELERLLGMNSKNSSKPPSSDPPQIATELPRPPAKKRGPKKGHAPHLKALLPPEKVKERVYLKPEVCRCGGTTFERTTDEPLRHQTIDIPPIEPEVIEYVQPIYRCRACGARVYQPLPDQIRRNHFGPGVLALVAVLTGMLNTSKRKALAMINEVFSVPMSLGGLSHCEAQLAQALESAYQETITYVRDQPVNYADETGWRRGNRQRGWLWALCCGGAAVFMIQAKRGQKAASKLFDTFRGVLVSDRWSAYNVFEGARQICWAHLKRDFKAISESQDGLGKTGCELYSLAKKILKLRRRVRDGTLPWPGFQRRMVPFMQRVEALLQEGAGSPCAFSRRCRRILKHRAHLWTFVYDPRVDPTNNRAERSVRQGVLWRKSSFGTQSQRGARYVERILTVCATCRLQGRSIIEYLRDVCRCHLDGFSVPSLVSPQKPSTQAG